MGIEDREPTDYDQHLRSAQGERAGLPNDSNILPPDISPSSGGTVERTRGGRKVAITVGTQSAFTETGELTTEQVVPNYRGRPRPLQPIELQGHSASKGLGDRRVNEKATRQKFAIARNQDKRRQRRSK